MTLSVQSVFKKQFGLKNIRGDMFFSGIVTLFALIFFLIFGGGFVYDDGLIIYSAIFGICYAVCTVASLLAIKWGSLAISSLILSYSLVIPAMYGLIFLHEKAGIVQLAGMAALLVSLFLVNKKEAPGEKKGVTLKWIAAAAVSFFANGGCSVVMKEQQRVFEGRCDSSFMIIALSVAATLMLGAGLIFERGQIIDTLRRGTISAALCGVSNAVTNYIVMVVVASVATSLFFPVLSAGQLVFTFLISVFVYKEKFLPRQLVGLGLGIAALVLLNL